MAEYNMKKIVFLYSLVLWKYWGTITTFYMCQQYVQTHPSGFHVEQHTAWAAAVKFDQLKREQNKA